jgi:hypothetical protein
MDDVSAWEQIRSRFLDGASEYPGLFAYWGATEELWTFGNSLPEEPDHPANLEAERLFKEVATAAIRLMGRTGNAEPPWHVWLDIMRKGKQGFRRLYAQTRTWKEFQTAMEVSVDAAKLPLTDNGTIASVFERSADFCEQLSYEAEIPSAETDPGEWLAASEAEASRIVKENAQRLQKQIDDAISLFETLPSFAPVQVRMRERMNEAKRALSGESKAYGRQARRPHVLLLLDIRAEEFLEFVTDIRTQNAYMAWLPSLESAALEDYTGAPPGILQPSSGDQLDFVDEISERLGHWRLEGYKRVASRVKASPNSVDQRASEGESPRSQFTSLMESSSRFRTKYLKALATLLDKLNECWEKVLPPNAHQPLGSAEEFFEPFAQFGVALYNACARERLDSMPSPHLYQEALNFELKTLVCNLIAPYRETPIKSLQDALRADEQGEFPGEWSLRMGESWRIFDHPRHDELQRSVRRMLLDENLLDWDRLQSRVHKAISKRVAFLLAEHAERTESTDSPASFASPGPPQAHAMPAVERAAAMEQVDATDDSKPWAVDDLVTLRPARWEDLGVFFISEERVQLVILSRTETRNFAELGFASKKSGLPVLAWTTLRKLAENDGTIQVAVSGQRWAAVEKRIQEIRRVFRRQFGLQEDPIELVRKAKAKQEEHGYRAKFRICCRSSYAS